MQAKRSLAGGVSPLEVLISSFSVGNGLIPHPRPEFGWLHAIIHGSCVWMHEDESFLSPDVEDEGGRGNAE